MTLLELAEACERAEGGSRELDVQIARAIGLQYRCNADYWGWLTPHWTDGKWVGQCPSCTVSLDDAMQLVLKDWHTDLQGVNDAWWCLLTHTPMQSLGGRTGQAETAPLALCAAALRARQAMESE